ncbi:MAG: hypothetical protein RMY36_017955 [Nostoc sp. SerVER01]
MTQPLVEKEAEVAQPLAQRLVEKGVVEVLPPAFYLVVLKSL